MMYTLFPQVLPLLTPLCVSLFIICSTHTIQDCQPITVLMCTSSSCTCHTWNIVPLPLVTHNNICLYFWDFVHWYSHPPWVFMFCLCLTHSLCGVYLCVTEEKRTAQSVRQRLWELLAPAGLNEDSVSSSWLHAYRRLLQEEGADEETQKKAVLMQLWASQVSQTSEERVLCIKTSRECLHPEIRYVSCSLRLWSCVSKETSNVEVQYSCLAHECTVRHSLPSC